MRIYRVLVRKPDGSIYAQRIGLHRNLYNAMCGTYGRRFLVTCEVADIPEDAWEMMHDNEIARK